MGDPFLNSYPDTIFDDIDVEHRAISRRMAALQEAVTRGDSGAAGEALSPLVQELVEHFVHEERLMEESGFAPDASHRAAHVTLVGLLRGWAAEFAANGLSAAFQDAVIKQLPQRLHGHIIGHDVPLALHLIKCAAKEATPA